LKMVFAIELDFAPVIRRKLFCDAGANLETLGVEPTPFSEGALQFV
jgi:hypothetical protein